MSRQSVALFGGIVLAATVGLAGCATAGTPISTATAGPTASPAADSWVPDGVHARRITVSDGGTATAAVGDWVTFTGPSEVHLSVDPRSLDLVTYYGPRTSLLMLHSGTVQIDFPNYDKHFDCPNGPCAHPNEPLHMALTVTAGVTAPDIPDPVEITDLTADSTVHLIPGQRLLLPPGAEASAYPGAQVVAWWNAGDRAELVAFEPGTARWDVRSSLRADWDDSATVTIVVDKP